MVALALVTALEHLHGHGLVHRDIKPSNVIFAGGVPKLADIGLVTSIDATQSFVGTEGFFPPEGPGTPQADIYSLGKLLYETATGKDRREFPELPADLTVEEQAALSELNAIFLKACQHDPQKRYATTAALHADLDRLRRGRSVKGHRAWQRRCATGRRLAWVAVTLGALVLSAYALYTTVLGPRETVQGSENSATVPLRASVFVLPFRGGETSEAGTDVPMRITDAFIDSLGSIEGVVRSPRRSGWRFIDEDELRRALAETNDMRHILTGRIASSNDTLALTLNLYPRGNDQPIWIESFSGNTNQLTALEWRALSALANQLGLRLSADEQQRIRVLLTNNLEALRCYQQADEVYNRKTGTQTGYREARELAQKAMRLDPHFLAADLHDIYMLRNLAQDRAPVEVWPDVKIRILRILEKDETFAPACELLAGYYFCFERDWEQAYAHWNRELSRAAAIIFSPTSSLGFTRD
jgi:TolB-like protein